MLPIKDKLLPQLSVTIEKILQHSVPEVRQQILLPVIDYIQSKTDQGKASNLNFICTHNSRRSQLAQIWAQTAAFSYSIPVNCMSGGVEVTAFNERAVESVKRSGFRIASEGLSNPLYLIEYANDHTPIRAFSKLFDDPVNQVSQFAAVMTCAHADENCPFIPGAEKRIAVRYDDPKIFDDTPLEIEKYDERSLQIASEMFFVFSRINNPTP